MTINDTYINPIKYFDRFIDSQCNNVFKFFI